MKLEVYGCPSCGALTLAGIGSPFGSDRRCGTCRQDLSRLVGATEIELEDEEPEE